MSAEDLLDTRDAAAVMGWVQATFYRRARHGMELPPRVDQPGRARYRRADVEEFKAKFVRTRTGPEPKPRPAPVARVPRATPLPKPLTFEQKLAKQRAGRGLDMDLRIGYIPAAPPAPGEVVAVCGLIARRATGPGEASILAAMILGDAA